MNRVALVIRHQQVSAAPRDEQPSLTMMAELLRWQPARVPLVAWRDAFDGRIERRWTTRGNRFLDRSAPWSWTVPAPTLEDTGIAVDTASAFEFPDDEPGLAATRPHTGPELTVATRRLRTAAAALRRASPSALEFVTVFVEMLALRSAPRLQRFHTSTFPGLAGLVRFANAHLPGVDTPALLEALVRESIHGLLHLHEEVQGPLVRPTHASCKITSPWTGTAVGLRAYVHACAVWYGLHHLWSLHGFASGELAERAEALRHQARAGFDHRPVSIRLAPFAHLLTPGARHLLWELEERMLSSRGAL